MEAGLWHVLGRHLNERLQESAQDFKPHPEVAAMSFLFLCLPRY